MFILFEDAAWRVVCLEAPGMASLCQQNCFLPSAGPDNGLYLHSKTQTNTCFICIFVAAKRKSKLDLPSAVFSGHSAGLLGMDCVFLGSSLQLRGC